jgi:Protein of unknown function (DUF2971)
MGGIVEKEVTIVGAGIGPEYPELHHYTDEAGLSGIVASNCFRATNYEDLNDSSEVVHLKERLRPELVGRLREILRRRRASNSRLDREIQRSGGMNKCADDLADDLIRSLYRTAFEPNSEDPLADTAGTPFIASFCSHRHDEYERENGLLSQWRGYGGKSGFCIVLDTARLGAMLGREFDTYAFTHLNLSPAHYADADTTVASAFPGVLTACEEIVERILSGQRGDSDALDQFFAAATLIKHRAFREEREVRIHAFGKNNEVRPLVAELRCRHAAPNHHRAASLCVIAVADSKVVVGSFD